jgi:hypothetical protein
MPDDDEGTDLKYFYKPVDPLLNNQAPSIGFYQRERREKFIGNRQLGTSLLIAQ